jgi:two-component system, response regulator YesN
MEANENDYSFSVRIALAALRRLSPDSDLRLETVARTVRLSRCHLSRLIKKETGHGFREHLRNVRMETARTALSQTTLSIKEVAAGCGFRNTSAFDREFKRVHGLSPLLWRVAHSLQLGCDNK